ncbi:hypothetical protein KR222_002571 [Zaprionus bogoriensis]|nr:hypothetical protein KR222_002571 [Zaprionus bogoriensis]
MESVQYSYEDFIRVPRFVYRLCGYEIVDTGRSIGNWKDIMMLLYHWACVGSHIVCVIYLLRRIIEWETIGNDVAVIIRYGTVVTFIVNSVTKYGTSLQRLAIRRLNGKVAELYPQTTESRIDHRVNEYYWSRALLITIALYMGSSAMVVVLPFCNAVLIYLKGHPFPYLHCYPFFIFDPQQDPWWYYLALYAFEWLHSTLMVIGNVGTDLWLISFEVQICMHFDYISRMLENYESNSSHAEDDRKFISGLVDHHTDLLSLQSDVNDIFGVSQLLSLITTAGVICTVSTYIQLQGFNLEAVTYVMFIMTTTSQFFLVCYYGELIRSQSYNISVAAYNHDWSEATSGFKKSLLIISIRAQQNVELSAMGYKTISLDTFKQVHSNS